jgi:hypothetical protein
LGYSRRARSRSLIGVVVPTLGVSIVIIVIIVPYAFAHDFGSPILSTISTTKTTTTSIPEFPPPPLTTASQSSITRTNTPLQVTQTQPSITTSETTSTTTMSSSTTTTQSETSQSSSTELLTYASTQVLVANEFPAGALLAALIPFFVLSMFVLIRRKTK